ncbi:hypothetical protein, partial [Polaromonas hydrogenivorans]|uniref:hypothetical protein n=1 Tax=Polaromonas hydrogenivorans TaxID=335476 RepID=UPI0039F0BF90
MQPGQTLQAPPLSAFEGEQLSQYAQYGNSLVSRNQRGLDVKAQIEAQQAALAQAQIQEQRYNLMMSGGPRGGTGAAYGDAPAAPVSASAAAGGRGVFDRSGAGELDSLVNGNPLADASETLSQGLARAVKSAAAIADGAVELAVKGSWNAMGARPASSVAALPAALFMGGAQAYTEIQRDLQQRWSAEIQTPGGQAIEAFAGQLLEPVAQGITQLRSYSQSQLGDGATTAFFATAQFGVEAFGFLGGVSGLGRGAARLGLDGASLAAAGEVATARVGPFAGDMGNTVRAGASAMLDAMPGGSSAGVRWPGYQIGAVGDLGNIRAGGLMRNAAS